MSASGLRPFITFPSFYFHQTTNVTEKASLKSSGQQDGRIICAVEPNLRLVDNSSRETQIHAQEFFPKYASTGTSGKFRRDNWIERVFFLTLHSK